MKRSIEQKRQAAVNGEQRGGATRAQLEHRAQQLVGPVAQQVTEYNAECWKQERDVHAARRLAKMLGVSLSAVRP